MAMIVRNHFPTEAGTNGSLFWAYTGNAMDEDKPTAGTLSNCGLITFPSKYAVYHSVTLTYLSDTLKRNPKYGKLYRMQTPYAKGLNSSIVVSQGNVRTGHDQHAGVGWKLLVFVHKVAFPAGAKAVKSKRGEYPEPDEYKESNKKKSKPSSDIRNFFNKK